MTATKTTPNRHEDVNRWALTSIAVTILVHLLLMHIIGGIRLFDVEVFSTSISRWFHVVEVPESPSAPVATPGIEPDERAAVPVPLKPHQVPLLDPKLRIPGPSFPDDKALAVPAHTPTPLRAPDTEAALIHRAGPPRVDQTDAAVGEVAPVRAVPVADVAPVGAGGRGVLRGSPGIPAAPPVVLQLREESAPKPATQTHAGALAPPPIKPSPTGVAPAATTPRGIVISIEDALARKAASAPPLIIFPAAPPDDESTPLIPLGDEVSVKMDLYARPGEELQYFRLEIAVARPDRLPVIPKDVVFICDVSLSIRRSEVIAARDALAAYLRALRPTDRFNVILFSEEPHKLFPDFVDPTPERIDAALAFVDRIPGQTRTDVYRVLNAVVRDVAEQAVRNRPTNIFFLSDGRSTLGIRDARRIINDIGAYAKPTFAILPFDAGSGGNRYLLDLLAYRSRGRATFTDDIDQASDLLARLFRTYDKPVLMQLALTYTNLDVADTYPVAPPNLYADQPVVLYGRCKPGQNVAIHLEGKNPYARRALKFTATPGAPDPSRADIAREWARQRIHHLVSDMARLGETPDLRAEIERIGREYQVRTPYDR